MLRRSASLVSRFGSGLPGSGTHLAAAAECGGPQSAAALHIFDRWQQHGSGGQGAGQQQHMTARHLSFWPGSGSSDKQPAAAPQQPESLAAAGEDFGSLDSSSASSSSFAASAAADGGSDAMSSAAAAASGMPGMADLFSAGAIVAAAAGAEADVLAAAREDSWIGTRAVQLLLTSVHDATGLAWWQSIMVTTLGMRLATLPIMIAQVKNTYRMSMARPEIEELVAHMKEEQARGNTDAAMQHQQRVMGVWKKHKCNPVKSLVGMFVQAPIFIGFFSALRGFAAHKLPSFAEGGAMWFTDLTIPDPTYILPALAGISFLATIELGAADGMEGQPEATRQKMKNVMRVVALIVPVVSISLPCSVFMYWTASNVFSLAQTLLLKSPAVKRVVGLPDLSKMRGAPKQADLVGKPVITFTSKPKPAAKKPEGAA